MISLIAAMDKNNVIGYENDMPWSLPNDLRHFKEVTSHHTIVMGRKTYESIGRPLPNRLNIILSRSDYQTQDQVKVISSIDEIKQMAKSEEIFVIGGGTIYEQFLPFADKLYITRIEAEFEGDTYFPQFDLKDWEVIDKKPGIVNEKNKHDHTFYTYSRKQIETD